MKNAPHQNHYLLTSMDGRGRSYRARFHFEGGAYGDARKAARAAAQAALNEGHVAVRIDRMSSVPVELTPEPDYPNH